VDPERPSAPEPLSPEDLSFWWADQPRQRTTMALLMLLDRRPDAERLRAAAARAAEAVPRLRQRVVDAPFHLARPCWAEDPTFDLDFHVRRYALAAPTGGQDELDALFRTVGPIYERPFDRTRPLWEMIEIDRSGEGSALFFKLHHAVADGVGGNAILAALTDATRAGEPLALPSSKPPPGAWPEAEPGSRLARAAVARLAEEAGRTRAVAGALWQAVRTPSSVGRAARIAGALFADAGYRSTSPLRRFGRARHLSGLELPFEELRALRTALGGRMIDVLLTGVAGAMHRWHAAQGVEGVDELLTLVPINLRPPAEQGLASAVGNRATGINVRLPISIADPLACFAEVHRRVEERKAHPAAEFFPTVAAILAAVPRPLYRSVARVASGSIELIVTNVPGVPVARYLAGAEITGAYPFAPVAPHCPVSIALYGYRGRLFVGLDADGTAVPDLDAFRTHLREAFGELVAAARDGGRPAAGTRRRRSRQPRP
jgi:diacylglycerol O-acyltransferase